MFINQKRKQEISDYMTAHSWVADYNTKTGLWIMCKEPYPYSDGPFEVLAMAESLEEVFDKAKKQQENA